MASPQLCRELMSQLNAVAGVRRAVARATPEGTLPPGVGALAVVDRCGATRTSRLAEALGVDLSVASRHVSHLETEGWITRAQDPRDRRSSLISLTPAGAEVLARAVDGCVAVLGEVVADWDEADVRTLVRLMARLRDGVEAARETHGPGTAAGAA